MDVQYGVEGSYHYPPELLGLLNEAIPLVFKGKQEVVRFFRSAGVDRSLLIPWEQKIATDREAVKKYEIAGAILVALNERRGNEALAQRREVLRKIVEIEDLSGTWDKDRDKAELLILRIRRLVEAKDTVGRMKAETDRESQKNREAYSRKVEAERKKRQRREKVKSELYALFAETNAQRRGNALEPILNEIFDLYGILIRNSFKRMGANGQGVVEQIDGIVEIDGAIYLVEMKWWNQPIGASEVSDHLTRVQSRAGAGGIFISASGYTSAAVERLTESMRDRTHVALELREIVFLLDRETDLREFLRERIRSAVLYKTPIPPT